ncbi:MAG: glycosyltransferase family 2 protein [Methanomassiliicoccales archaeon]|jgi:GT2 family glycosyltransferase
MRSSSSITAVTVNWNKPLETVRCIKSLKEGGVEDITIYVVDNGSNGNDIDLIRREVPDAFVFEMGKNLGYVKGINFGISKAMESRPSFILVINNDAYGSRGFITELLKGMERHQNAGIVGPKILYPDGRRIWYAGGEFNEWLGYSRHPMMDSEDDGDQIDEKVDFVTGCAMLVRREVFEEVGLFDQDYDIYAEDLDFCLRAAERGYESWYIPSSVVYHEVSSSTGVAGSNLMTPFRAYHYARNMFILTSKRIKGGKFITCIIGQFAIRFPYYFFMIALQKIRGAYLAYIRGIIDGLKFVVGGREPVED